MRAWESETKDKGRNIDYRAMLQQRHMIMGGWRFEKMPSPFGARSSDLKSSKRVPLIPVCLLLAKISDCNTIQQLNSALSFTHVVNFAKFNQFVFSLLTKFA